MAFCSVCGSEIKEGAAFCPSCGARVDNSAQKDDSTGGQSAKDQVIDAFVNTTDTTSEFDPQDISSNKIMAVLAYIGWLVLIPLFAAKNSAYARFHCNQGIVLAISQIVFVFILGLFKNVAIIGTIATLVASLGNILILVISVIGIINAAQGKAKELPIIGSIRILK